MKNDLQQADLTLLVENVFCSRDHLDLYLVGEEDGWKGVFAYKVSKKISIIRLF